LFTKQRNKLEQQRIRILKLVMRIKL